MLNYLGNDQDIFFLFVNLPIYSTGIISRQNASQMFVHLNSRSGACSLQMLNSPVSLAVFKILDVLLHTTNKLIQEQKGDSRSS